MAKIQIKDVELDDAFVNELSDSEIDQVVGGFKNAKKTDLCNLINHSNTEESSRRNLKEAIKISLESTKTVGIFVNL